MLLAPFVVSLLLCLILVPTTRRLSERFGFIAQPRQDRWHRKPTPKMGGIAIFLAFFLPTPFFSFINREYNQINWGLFVGAGIVFLLGLYDDLRSIAPSTKLLGQILAASVIVFSGYTTNFFSPRIPDPILARSLNILLTFIWLVGITNTINLLDNMDGLAGGVSFITSCILSYFFWRAGNESLLGIAMALAGSTLGFLMFNFPPASIFMGDSGSLFLGFTLATLSIARQPQASNVLAVVGVPTLLFLLPILDTAMVTFTRLLRGQSPIHGGMDHTSHRLVAFGLSERQAVLVLYLVAFASGAMAAILESINYRISLVLAPVLVLSLALLAAYLSKIKVVAATSAIEHPNQPITRFMQNLIYRQHLLEIVMDFFLIAMAYYLAFLTRYGLTMDITRLELCLESLPLAWAGAYLSFIVFGIYRSVWRYFSVDDLLRFAKAALGTIVLISIPSMMLYSWETYSPTIFGLFAFYLFLTLSASRSSFKVLDQVHAHQVKPREERVLICGAGDAGELILRWMMMNPQLGYHPVGFLDDDAYKVGRHIHGVEVLGSINHLENVLEEKKIDGVIITSGALKHPEDLERILTICRLRGCWVRNLRFELEMLA